MKPFQVFKLYLFFFFCLNGFGAGDLIFSLLSIIVMLFSSVYLTIDLGPHI